MKRKDRGLKKWHGAFFMPEHVAMLKKVNEDYYKQPRPQLDEGQIEEMEQLILESLENQVLLEITTWKNGFFTSRIGTVTKVDPINKKVMVKDEHHYTLIIDFFTITSVINK